MNNEEIQIQFPQPSERDKFTLTAIYQDAEGYAHTDRYTQDDIPADQAPAMQAVVAALVGLAEPWKASQVWARLGKDALSLTEDGTYEMIEAVSLTVEAVNDQGGRRIFTTINYPAFVLTDPAAVAFFKYFTKQNHE
ncbi:hypothetical protein ACAZ27_00310 [Akkermansia muciniphila]|jgi:hypothetical protein|nr:hypothetical protein CXU18_00305 [Akkermansia muciniphila]PNC51755.1 hypothetical protein CXU15_04620 [Akkermansia muciniphila]DAJ78846.1 MAG TPA: hypothetical protein [Caudoviricetes sp.]